MKPFSTSSGFCGTIEETIRATRPLTLEDPWLLDYQSNNVPGFKKPESYDPSFDYYEEFWKTYLTNQLVIKKISEVSMANDRLTSLIRNLEHLLSEKEDIDRRQKKNRRTSCQIDKRFGCPYDGCSKSYGCDVALNLHIKLKHKGGNKTQRQQLAREICEADANGRPRPQLYLHFPPGFLDNYRKIHFVKKVT